MASRKELKRERRIYTIDQHKLPRLQGSAYLCSKQPRKAGTGEQLAVKPCFLESPGLKLATFALQKQLVTSVCVSTEGDFPKLGSSAL